MSLSKQDVEHVARLARMQLSGEELERMRTQLSAILDYMQVLNEVDIAGVPPTSQVTGLVNVMRPDEARPSLSAQQALSNAPAREGDYLRVKAVFDEE